MNTDKVNICIIENDFVIQETLQLILTEIGHNVLGIASDEADAIIMLTEHQPELVLLDIGLDNEHGGIDVAKFIREAMNVPFIFITGNSDRETLSKAKQTNPDAYLLKPFKKEEIFIAIEVALQNFNDRKKQLPPETIFVKDGNEKYKIELKNILFIESSHVYISIVTTEKKVLVRGSITEFMEKLPANMFVRVHRSFIINLKKISSVTAQSITIGNEIIPVSKNYKAALDGALQHIT